MKTWSYVRKVPADCRAAFGKTNFILSLQTQSPRLAQARAERVTRMFDRNLKLARSGKPIETITVVDEGPVKTRSEIAEELLRKMSGIYGDFTDVPEPVADAIMQDLTDYAQNFETKAIDQHKAPVVKDAITLLRGGEVTDDFTMSMCVERYLQYKGKAADTKFRKPVDAALRNWLEVHEDNPLRTFKRVDALTFINHHKAAGLSAGSIRRRITSLKAAIALTAKMTEQDIKNIFAGVVVEDDTVKADRSRLEHDHFQQIANAPDDEVANLTKLLVNTGMRIGEAAGLKREDIILDANIPHVLVRPNSKRSVKTKTSVRSIPLVGISLRALQDQLAGHNDEFVFPRYNKAEETNTNSSSAAVKKRFGINTHYFRHDLITRMRDKGIPYDLQQLIVGHSLPGVTGAYGSTDLLEAKLEALLKIKMP